MLMQFSQPCHRDSILMDLRKICNLRADVLVYSVFRRMSARVRPIILSYFCGSSCINDSIVLSHHCQSVACFWQLRVRSICPTLLLLNFAKIWETNTTRLAQIKQFSRGSLCYETRAAIWCTDCNPLSEQKSDWFGFSKNQHVQGLILFQEPIIAVGRRTCHKSDDDGSDDDSSLV